MTQGLTETGDCLMKFSQECWLKISKTWFIHPTHNLSTVPQPFGLYIMQPTMKNAIISDENLPGADSGLDHQQLVAKVHFTFKFCNTKKENKTLEIY